LLSHGFHFFPLNSVNFFIFRFTIENKCYARNNVALVSDLNQLNTFQMILATDNVNSFVLFYFVRLDSLTQGACLVSSPSSNASLLQYSAMSNCSLGGIAVNLINSAGFFFQNKFSSQFEIY
jgi:hypothetical protein